MKLKDYFNQVSKEKLSDSQKMAIFEKFVEKTYKKSLLRSVSFYFKIWVYTVLIVFFLFSFFPFIFYKTSSNFSAKTTKITSIKSVTTWVYIENVGKKVNKKSLNTAFANYIWKIIYAKWNFSIIRSWSVIKTDKIFQWDYLLLDKYSYLKFSINSGVIAVIKWPAKLNIFYDKFSRKYIINLIDWKFFNLSGSLNSWGSVEVKSQDLIVEPKDKKDINFKIVENNKKVKFVENEWKAPILVKKISKKKAIKKVVLPNQKVEVNDEIKLIKNLKKQIESWKLSKTVNISWDNTYNVLVMSSTKVVPTEDQMSSFKILIYPSFVRKDIYNLVYYYLKGNKSAYNIALKNIFVRILKIYKTFGLKIDSEILRAKIKWWNYNLDDLFLIVDQLISKLNNRFYILPEDIFVLKKIEGWIIILKNQKFGSFSDEKISSLEQILKVLKLGKFKSKLLF
jgi:hypothetical protein